MSDVVKGWVTSLGRWTKGDLALWVARNKDKMHAIPVLLIPDDGTHRVVTVEEWERLHAAAWRVGAGALQDQSFASDETFARDVCALMEIVKDTGPRAILGTNGDTHE